VAQGYDLDMLRPAAYGSSVAAARGSGAGRESGEETEGHTQGNSDDRL